jgi:hypothetical protein
VAPSHDMSHDMSKSRLSDSPRIGTHVCLCSFSYEVLCFTALCLNMCKFKVNSASEARSNCNRSLQARARTGTSWYSHSPSYRPVFATIKRKHFYECHREYPIFCECFHSIFLRQLPLRKGIYRRMHAKQAYEERIQRSCHSK